MARGTISLRLFGGASLERDGRALSGPPAQRHRLALLALLCVAHPRALSRDRAMGYLWPERDDRHARQLLNQTLHVLRKALGDGAIVSAGDELQLGSPPLACDVLGFEEALAAGDRARAAALYAGPLLDGFFLGGAPEFEHWLDQERERLRREWRAALGELADERLRAGDADAAATSWRRLLADDPYDARATVGLMEALEAMGDRAGALRRARLHEVLLQEEFGAGADPAVRAVAERIRVGGGAAAPLVDGPASSGGPEATEVPGAVASTAPRWSWKRRGWLAAALVVVAAVAWIVTRAPAAVDGGRTRIAVLPLANLTGDPGQDYFVAGMHDALISELARVGALTVLSRQSVLRYADSPLPLPDIAKELGADAVVEGSVFRSGDSVRINVQLVGAEPERHLASQTFTGPLDRALALQGRVARAVAEATRARITPAVRARLSRGRAVDPGAQEAYLAGLYHLEHASYGHALPLDEGVAEIRRAIAKLEEAVARDSTWAAAHAKLALARHWLASSSEEDSDESFARSKAAALRAIALDPAESQAYASLGFVLLYHEWDWEGAERAIRRANELDPNSHHWIYALFLSAAGRHDQAIAEFRKAQERDPASDLLKAQTANEYACAGQYDRSTAEARELHARVAAAGRTGAIGDTLWLLSRLATNYALDGEHEKAIDAARRLVALTDTLDAGPQLAFALAMGGRDDEARAVIARLGPDWADRPGGWQPPVLAALGDADRAVASAVAVAAVTERPLVRLACWPGYRLLRDEPRFQELLRSLRQRVTPPPAWSRSR